MRRKSKQTEFKRTVKSIRKRLTSIRRNMEKGRRSGRSR